MARKRKPTDCLKPGKADEVFQRITAWHQTDNPTPEELLEWLDDVSGKLGNTVSNLHANKAGICGLDENTRLKASSIVFNSLDFLDRADVAAELLAGVVGGRVRDAFVEGLRCGLLYERIMSLIDGRYADHWAKQDGRQRGARTTNEAHAELQQGYQADVDRLMRDGATYTAACQQVASSRGVNERTVRNNTANPAPRNSSRHRRKAL